MKQLERRIIKLEAPTEAKIKAHSRAEIETLVQFLTSAEAAKLGKIWGELGRDHPAAKEIVQRSATRREHYPRIWLPLCGAWRRDPIIAEPWSEAAEIEALRNEVARQWERRGLALVLDALTPAELGIVKRLQDSGYHTLGTWGRVQYLVKSPDEIEIAKVWLYARVDERDKHGYPATWQDVGRPLTWADLELDPATFPVRCRADQRMAA
jgi:hypothetical protein